MVQSEPVDQKDLWGTPWPVIRKLEKDLGVKFTLDPAATIDTAKAPKFFTPEDSGLTKAWNNNTVFCNPPYSRYNIDKWVAKMFIERKTAFIIALLPVSTSADWYHNHISGKQEVWFVNKRIRFTGAAWTAPFSSMIVLFNDKNIHRSWDQPIKTINV